MSEREWREAGDLQPSRVALLAILLIAAVLRFWALGHGIPYSLGVDEPEIVERAVNILRSGSLHPHFFDYPAFYIYLQAFVALVRFLTGAMSGMWASLAQAGPEHFYLWGRAVTALFGVATVWLVFQAGMRWGARHALLAAGLLAVQPLHVRQSHYVLTDVPLTFFVTLALLLSLRAHEERTVRAFAWAGVAAGLAAATKYNGAAALLMPLAAAWMTLDARPSRGSCVLAAAAGCGLAFLAAAPYTLLALPEFLDGFARLASIYSSAPPPPEPGWILYLKHLRLIFGWPAFLLMGAGLVLGVVRLVNGPGRVRWTLVTLFPLVYFWLIADQRLIYGRYLLPLVPSVCLLAATAVISGVSLLRRYEIPRAPRTALITGLTVAALLPPSIQSVGFDQMISAQSTVEQARLWIEAHLPHGSRVAIETRALMLPAASYTTAHFPSLIRDHLTRAPRTREHYLDEGFEYLVASSQSFGPALDAPQRDPESYEAYMTLFGQCRELARFTPSGDHPGPEMRIYRLTPDAATSPASTGR
jgi:4-amino-4-deoxy-L-arabinose transferase-like glycosyltransferase